ncbi:MAG: acetyltransferase [Desulfurellales bacterium]|nr:MAG: acetyltransferase [Desulfurellales bacterium]
MTTSTDFWAIVEVMGHKKFAGRVTEQVIGGASFVRVDVPASGDELAYSKLFGAGSIYCITPVDEQVARAVAPKCGESPVSVWNLPEEWQTKIRARSLPAPQESAGEDYSQFDEED